MPTSNQNQKIKYEYIIEAANQYVINREMIGKNLMIFFKSLFSNNNSTSCVVVIRSMDIDR